MIKYFIPLFLFFFITLCQAIPLSQADGARLLIIGEQSQSIRQELGALSLSLESISKKNSPEAPGEYLKQLELWASKSGQLAALLLAKWHLQNEANDTHRLEIRDIFIQQLEFMTHKGKEHGNLPTQGTKRLALSFNALFWATTFTGATSIWTSEFLAHTNLSDLIGAIILGIIGHDAFDGWMRYTRPVPETVKNPLIFSKFWSEFAATAMEWGFEKPEEPNDPVAWLKDICEKELSHP